MHPSYLLIPYLAASAQAAVIGSRAFSPRAAYFLDNNPEGSSIVSLAIAENGTLYNPVRTSTGGIGELNLVANATGPAAPGPVDPLVSQNSVVVSGDYLFTVNAGSNTVSMFTINKNDPSHPTLLSTMPSLGEFPSTVAYSPALKTACVLNAGAVAGVACYSVTHTGLAPLGALRPIALNQTTPPVGPAGTASDIVFNPSSTALFAITKGSPTKSGAIYAYPVSSNIISTTPVISSPSGLLLDFTMSFLGSDSQAVVADPAYGASLVAISPTYEVTVNKAVVVANQGAVCWTNYSPRFNTVFLMDAGQPNITLVDPGTGAIKGVTQLNADGKGSLDAAVDRSFLYVLRGSNTVTVLGLKGLNNGKVASNIQNLDLSALGSRQGWTGMAIYP